MTCINNCGEMGPPPDMILSMPPPPLPTFLLPKSAIVTLSGNKTHPCFAAFICETNARPRDIEFIEFSGKGHITFGLENTWLFIIFASFGGILLLGAFLVIVLMKYRRHVFITRYNHSHQASNMKQSTISALGQPSKSNPFISGGMLYPCASDKDSIQQHLTNESRLLWATLTPDGTKHFVSDFPARDKFYERVDSNVRAHNQETVKRRLIKSFDNNGFVDYDYEEPTSLTDSYHDDLDSGYQEPQEVIGSLTRNSPRLAISSPTKIENPNIPPLNIYPHKTSTGTLNKKSTLGRRINDGTCFVTPNI